MLSPESRRAVVAVQPHIFGLGRMMAIYHEYSEHADTQVFYSIYEALALLARTREG